MSAFCTFYVLYSWNVIEILKSSKENYYPKNSWFPMDAMDYSTTDTEREDENRTKLLLSHLKAYTQYAYYIRTTTTSNAGAISTIQYFLTNPASKWFELWLITYDHDMVITKCILGPSTPRNVKATAVNSTSITVSWDPPSSPNGRITHFIIEWQRQSESDIINARMVDTCDREGMDFVLCIMGAYIFLSLMFTAAFSPSH